jgi:ADP-heptose:LPS heptosyltransferase
MKILIIRFSSIGDIVLTTPVIRNVKTQLDAEIHFASKIQFKSFLENNPYIDRLHLLDTSLKAFVEQLRQEKFDYIVDLHHNLRTRIIKTLLGVRAYSFNKLNWQKWLIVNLKINRLPDQHIVERYMKTVHHLGVKNDALGLDFFIPEKDEVPWEWLPESHRREFTAYAIGGQHATKRLPVEKMIELCIRINHPIVLLGGKEDWAEGEKVFRFFEDQGNHTIFNACGKYSLNQSASLLKKSRIVFSHDTGLMHIAAAFKKEVFSIWGNTIPAFGMTPYRTKFVNLENNHLSCRPCSKIGFDKCPKGHFKCMRELEFEFFLPKGQ